MAEAERLEHEGHRGCIVEVDLTAAARGLWRPGHNLAGASCRDRIANRHLGGVEVDVAPAQTDHFAAAHTGCCENNEGTSNPIVFEIVKKLTQLLG